MCYNHSQVKYSMLKTEQFIYTLCLYILWVIRRGINMNQWGNTKEVISWFKRIKNKEKNSFTKFDIVDSYLSISKDLLTNANVNEAPIMFQSLE